MKRIRPILRIIGTLFGIALLIYQSYNGYLAIRSQQIQLRFYGYLGLAVFLIMVVMGLYYCAWKILMGGFAVTVPFLAGFRGFMLSFVARYIPGTIWGYLNRNEWLAQEYKVPHRISLWGSVYEIGLTALSSIVMVSIQGITQTNSALNKWLLPLLVVLLVVFSWILVKRVAKLNLIKRWLPNNGYGLDQYPGEKWFATLAILVGNWLMYGAMVYLCLLAFGIPVENIFTGGTLIQLSGVFSLSWLIGFIMIFLPSGLGVREVSLAILLPTVMAITQPQAAAVSVAARLITTAAELALVTLFALTPLGKTKRQS